MKRSEIELGSACAKRLLNSVVHKHGIVRRTVDRLARENGFPEDAAMEDTAVRFLTIALAGVMESWLRGELTQTPEELIAIFSTIFQDYVRGLSLRLEGGDTAG